MPYRKKPKPEKPADVSPPRYGSITLKKNSLKVVIMDRTNHYFDPLTGFFTDFQSDTSNRRLERFYGIIHAQWRVVSKFPTNKNRYSRSVVPAAYHWVIKFKQHELSANPKLKRLRDKLFISFLNSGGFRSLNRSASSGQLLPEEMEYLLTFHAEISRSVVTQTIPGFLSHPSLLKPWLNRAYTPFLKKVKCI
jgi:hypothetical protein